MPPCPGLAAIPIQPPSATCRQASANPGVVRTAPFSSRAGSRSPARLSGASTSSASRAASPSTASTVSGVASANRAVSASRPAPSTRSSRNRISPTGAR